MRKRYVVMSHEMTSYKRNGRYHSTCYEERRIIMDDENGWVSQQIKKLSLMNHSLEPNTSGIIRLFSKNAGWIWWIMIGRVLRPPPSSMSLTTMTGRSRYRSFRAFRKSWCLSELADLRRTISVPLSTITLWLFLNREHSKSSWKHKKCIWYR